MNLIRWTPAALEDMQGISSYTEGHRNLAAANQICRTIYNAIQRLRRFPESGKIGLEPGTRELVVPELKSYIVVYRQDHAGAVEVLRIWHGAQDR